MALFLYSAKDFHGTLIKGKVEAPTIEKAHALLDDRQLAVVTLHEQNQSALLPKLMQYVNHVGAKDITFFSRQLSVMINANIPVVRSLKTLVHQTDNSNFKAIIADIATEVEGGAKLSQTLNRYPQVFDQFFVHMIRAGETTGQLDQVLDYLAIQKEKDYALRSKVIGAMIYPIVILTTMIVIGVLMMIYVVPKITSIVIQSGAALPITTKILIATSGFLVNYWWVLLLLIIASIVGGVLYIRTEAGRYSYDYIKLHAPIMGPIVQRIALTRLTISLSNLLASGVPVTRALEICADIVNNKVYHHLIHQAIQEVEGGGSIANVFLHSKDMPSIVPQMMLVGEETGQLDSILKKLGLFYSGEVENILATLTSLIEPVVIIMLGIGAAIMVTGILLPIYNATSSFT
jgi:type II secretory pathway component PulF